VIYLNSVSAVSFAADHHHKKNEKPYALIFGTVWGPDDRPLYGVKIRIRRTDQRKRKLQAGSEVTVHIDNDERADIGLHLKYQKL